MFAIAAQAPRRLTVSIRAALIGALLLAGTAHATDEAATDDPTRHADNATTLSGVQVKANVTPPTAAYAGGQVAQGGRFGVLGNQDLMNVPFNMTSYTDTLIRNQQARSLGDVVANDPSVRTGFGYGNFSQTFVIRGFQVASDDIGFDGLYGLLPRQLLAPELVNRVEVFKGASAFLNGISPGGSAVGGNINIAPKRAEATPITRIGLDWGSNSQTGGSVDIGRRFGRNDAFGLRVNAVHRDGNTAIDGEQRRVTALGVAFDFHGDNLRITTDLGYQKQVITGGRAVVYTSGLTYVPRAPSAKTNYAQPWSNSSLEDTFGAVRAEYDFTPWLTGYVAAGAHHGNEYGDYVSPTLRDGSGRATETRFTVAYIADAARAHASQKGVKFELQVPETLLATADAGQLQQALMNLVLNAVDASDADGTILLRAGAQNEAVLIEVQNAGSPIPDAIRNRLFEPFFTTKPRGTGLGLAIARNIARAQGGDLRLAENGPSCVRFSITLPLAPDHGQR